MFTGVSRVDPEYESSQIIISAQMRTGQRVVAVRHCVTVAFLTPFFCVQNVRDILSARWRVPLLCGKVRSVLCKNVYPLSEGYVFILVKYSHDRMPKKNDPAISWPMAVFRCVFFCL